MKTNIRMNSGRTFEVPVFFEVGGLAVTPWIVVGLKPFPSKEHFAITQLSSGAIIVSTPYMRLPDAVYVCQQLAQMLDWTQYSYDEVKAMLDAGQQRELRDFLAEEVYQGLVAHEERMQRMNRRSGI